MVLEFVRDEQGATSVEYAMVASLIAVAIVGAVLTVGASTFDLYERVKDKVVEAMS